MLLPTGKPHVSFSEVKTWTECGYRHKLSYIDKIEIPSEKIHADFGTILHNTIESYLKTKSMNAQTALDEIDRVWSLKSYKKPDTWKGWAANILAEVPDWLEKEFPGWSYIGAEFELYENIPEEEYVKFKGFVDCLISAPGFRGKDKVWIIDWKTGPAYGWKREKKEDPMVLSQLYLYKDFLMRKLEIEKSSDVGVAFVVLKKGAKPGNCIDRVDVSAGPKKLEESRKLLKNMISGVKNGKFIKNKYACEWCDFAKSGHCKR